MARRNKRKPKQKRTTFKFTKPKKKVKRKISVPNLAVSLKILAVLAVLAAIGFGLVFLDRHVKKIKNIAEIQAALILVDMPDWVNEPLKEKIYSAATVGGQDFRIDDNLAKEVQQNIISKVVWFDEFTVQVTNQQLQITGKWRKPLALVKWGARKFYLNKNLIVLDYVPIANLPIVKIEGWSAATSLPKPGQIFEPDDLAAAVAILARLDRMDKILTPEKPLLFEIDRLDISNFNGRLNNAAAHIILYTKDNTQITWGAQLGAWHRHLEATDEEKLAKLYAYYQEHGTLLGGAKYINLRDPQQTVPLPIDKYQ